MGQNEEVHVVGRGRRGKRLSRMSVERGRHMLEEAEN